MSQRSTGPVGPPAGGEWPDEHAITATVTSATRVTGKVAGLGGIKVGDQVSAQLTQGGGRVTAVTIADPAQAPAGGSLP